ncbi:hypothetical protein D039_0809A, partial [Vibrio parahaemolyticus EKP-028]
MTCRDTARTTYASNDQKYQ